MSADCYSMMMPRLNALGTPMERPCVDLQAGNGCLSMRLANQADKQCPWCLASMRLCRLGESTRTSRRHRLRRSASP